MSQLSFYDLAFGVAPGGARKDAHYVRGSLDEVKADLASELAAEINLYLLCWYGADLTLDVYQDGERTRSIDLHPFITIAIEGCPQITFTGPGKPVGHDFGTDEEEGAEEGSLSGRMFMGDLGDTVKVTVDWNRIEVPPLQGRVAQDGDHVVLHQDAPAEYGYADFEI
ncbi:hypothetical protein AB0D04_21545 [Streptomyces sp. NPDC048483]|uniref:hypothetical protein n=1 Tax=Streptomyces sp. NPDC048483 TaxID=3154927 RepID=UPI0034492CD7